ncbi:MAG TPA: hypothetical protein VF469_02195 [Kofleriaceae bacterium]
MSLAAVGMVTVAGCSDNDDNNDNNAQLHVHNNSNFAIVEIRVTSVGSTTWGENLISGQTLASTDSLTINVSCGTYDALLVDQQGVACQVHNVELCGNHADWVIDNNTCTVFGASKAAAEANGSAAPAAH